MCLLFFKFDPNPPPDGFKLILCSNRDEYLDRPTKPADWWPSNPDIMSGVDLQQGREGGTWLGINKCGRLATLLNILQPEVDPNAKGRGALISNFLSGTDECLPYLQEISKEGHLYNGFNLLVFDILRPDSEPVIGYYSNKTDQGPELLSPGVHGFCNAPVSRPWKKCEVGKDKFTEVVHGATTGQKEELIDGLLEMMSDTTPYPDESIHRQCAGRLPPKMQLERSAICVRSQEDNYGSRYYDTRPAEQKGAEVTEHILNQLGSIVVRLPNYGTRTHTMILIDDKNEVSYFEKTLDQPVPMDADKFKWITNSYNFSLETQNPVASAL